MSTSSVNSPGLLWNWAKDISKLTDISPIQVPEKIYLCCKLFHAFSSSPAVLGAVCTAEKTASHGSAGSKAWLRWW